MNNPTHQQIATYLTNYALVRFVRKHALKSPSSVQYAISALPDRQLLTYQSEERTKTYSVSDRFLEMWISKTY